MYACETKEDIFKFITGYLALEKFDLDNIVLIEFDSDANFVESYDHSATFFRGARAVVCYTDVQIRNIRLHSIHLDNN